MTPLIDFFIPGLPRPGGSKTAKAVFRKDGSMVTVPNGRGGVRPLITVRDDAKGNADWKALVAHFAQQAVRARPEFPVPPGQPLLLQVVFTMPRRKGDYRSSGEVKSTAPIYHTVKPDGTKLMRSTEDALTGILWADDAQVSAPLPLKVYGTKPGARVIVTSLKSISPAQVLEGMALFARSATAG